MRVPIFRSPIVLALAAFAGGLVVKWALKPAFSVGVTMVVILWLLPFIGLAMYADVVPERLGRGRHSWSSFLSRENWFELLALLALPGFGFAVDVASLTLWTAAFSAMGVVGIIACIHLELLGRKKRTAGHGL